MRPASRQLVSALVVCLALLTAAAAQSTPPPPGPFLPADDSDLAALTQAAKGASAASAACTGRTSCPQFSCDRAKALNDTLDEAHAMLPDMKDRLHEAALDELDNLQSLQNERTNNELADQRWREALDYSKFLTSSAKITLDVASLADAANTLSDLYDKFRTPNLELSQLDQILAAEKVSDQVFELANGGISAADDAKAHLSGLTGSDPYAGFVPEEVAKLQTKKAAFSDVAGAAQDVREQLAALAQEKGVSNMARVKAASAASLKGLLSVLSKFLQTQAENQQKALEDSLQENAIVEAAIDKAYRSGYHDYLRMIAREAQTQLALDAVGDAYNLTYQCAVNCEGVLGPRPAEKTIDTQYGRQLATGLGYADALRRDNARVLTLAQTIGNAAGAFQVAPGQAPRITASPKSIETGQPMTAQYSLPACKVTEGCEIRLVGPEAADQVQLGGATRGGPQTLPLTAPQYPGNYEVRIVQKDTNVVASDSFVVRKKSLAGFTQEFQVHVTAIRKFYQLRKVGKTGGSNPPDPSCGASDSYGKNGLGSGHNWRFAVMNGAAFMHDEYDNSGFDSATGKIGGDGTFEVTGNGYRFDGKISFRNVKLPVEEKTYAAVPVATGTGTFEQVWAVIGQPCYPAWVVDFTLIPAFHPPYSILPARTQTR